MKKLLYSKAFQTSLACELQHFTTAMAKNSKIAKELKGPGKLDLLPIREQQSKSAALYLLELRSRQSSLQTQIPRRKLVASVGHLEGNTNLPRIIKIKHA